MEPGWLEDQSHYQQFQGKKMKANGTTLTLAVTDGQVKALQKVTSRVKKRNPLATKSDVVRELIGFTDHGLLTESDRKIISGGVNA